MSTFFEVNPKVNLVSNAEGGLAFNTQTAGCFILNDFGIGIWQRLARGASVESVVAEISEISGVQQERVAIDVDTFLSSLTAKGLVKPKK